MAVVRGSWNGHGTNPAQVTPGERQSMYGALQILAKGGKVQGRLVQLPELGV